MGQEKKIFRLAELLVKSFREDLSPGEQDILDRWIKESPRNRKLYERYKTTGFLESKIEQARSIDWQADCQEFLRTRMPERKTFVRRRLMKYAAMILLPLTAGWSAWYFIGEKKEEYPFAQAVTVAHQLPVLTLGNGERIFLTDSLCVKESDGTLVDAGNKVLSYTPVSLPETTEQELVYNQLEIPRGAEYVLTLSDGTRVWLNSESKLRYPVNFTGEKREVFVEGEAYFQVRHDAEHPFVVHAEEAGIEVLGTEFNVNTYENEVVTTLVNGSVRMSSEKKKRQMYLIPGEQGCVDKNSGDLQKQAVDTYLYTAWKDGRFVFRNTRMEELLNTLGRWYDLTVFYQHESVKDIRFTGDMPRMGDFHQLLNIIGQNGRVGFQIKGRTVTIMAK